jgi:hypothetical protein
MPALDFPNIGLYTGYQYSGPNGVVYTYDGTKWNGSVAVAATTATTGAFTTIAASGTTTLSGNAIISVTDNTNAALRITQLGTGNALLVEDNTNPDSSPFVIDTNGRVIRGTTSTINTTFINGPYIQNTSASAARESSIGLISWVNAVVSCPSLEFAHSKSGTVGTQLLSAADDALGQILFEGDDGTQFIRSASISAFVDGTPGTNNMPGRLVFSTTADGASSPTERVRITSAGNVGIGAIPTSRLHVRSDADALTVIEQIQNRNAGANAGGVIAFINSASDIADNRYAYIGAVTSGAGQNGNNLVFATNPNSGAPVERMRIDSSGNVGIGTSSPSARLDVAGTIKSTSYTETIFAVTGTTPALSPTNGTIQTWTLTANSTPTAGTWDNGQSLTLMIDDGTARTITWTSLAVTWKTNGGTAPTLQTTGFTAIQLWKVGNVIYGARVGDN